MASILSIFFAFELLISEVYSDPVTRFLLALYVDMEARTSLDLHGWFSGMFQEVAKGGR